MFSIEILILTLVTIFNLVVVWMIASQSWHIPVNRYFVLAGSCVVIWSASTAMLIGGTTPELVAVGRVLFLTSPMYVMLFLSIFAAVFPHYKGRPFTLPNIIFVIATIIFSIFAAYNPAELLPVVTLQPGHNNVEVNPATWSLYAVYFNIAFLLTFGQMFKQLRRAKGYQRKHVLYVFIGTLMSAILSLITNLILPIIGNSDFIWLGAVSTVVYVVSVSISIIKYQLFDIKLAAVRSIAYIGVLGTMAAAYYAIAYVVSVVLLSVNGSDAVSTAPLNIFLALVLAVLFQPIKRFFDRVTNDIFYRNAYRSEDFFVALSDLLSSTVDLRGLLERASEEIGRTFKAEQAFFFLYRKGTSHHMSAGTHKHSVLPLHDARMLDEHVLSDPSPATGIFTIESFESDSPLRRMLVSHNIGVVMPLRQHDEIMGYLLLGYHRSARYTERDLNVLKSAHNELMIAIQNAMSLHEVKELNATLQQRIDVATKELRSSNAQLKHLDEIKDEFMSMASHQLRTPLTSIKGYLSMVLEGDAGKITPQQHKLLLEAFNSSERMVRLIADFLNVSRLQTGKFIIERTTFDLGKAVEQEVRNLELIAGTHDVKLRLKIANAPLLLHADEQKIRQVIMNFIDNAIYYSHPKTTILINIEKVKGDAAVTVVDTGIGVPVEEQARLFTKFFRAKNARKQRPDGTGVGLYLARRVINGHSGKIIFSSKEGHGSTFGFRLPLARVTELPKPKEEPAAAKV